MALIPPPLTDTGNLLGFVIDAAKSLEAGDLGRFPDPAAPDLDTPLTQAEINVLKWVVRDIQQRFNPPTGGGE